MRTMVEVPAAVRNKALAVDAADWLGELDEIVASLAAEWGMSVGRAYPDATEALVAEAILEDGTPAVLKVMIPRGEDLLSKEATVLRLCRGRGCVALLRADPIHRALLLERLGPSLHELGLPIERRHRILSTAASAVWRPAPDCGLPTGAEKARWLASYIATTWEALDRPCGEAVVAYALQCAERRAWAHDDDQAVLVHGDVHQWNALLSPVDDGMFKLVDPDGLLADAEYDLGIIMREDPVELLEGDPWERAHRLARATGRDAQAIWEWGVVERVSTGLLGTQIGLQPVAGQMLAAAERITSLANGGD